MDKKCVKSGGPGTSASLLRALRGMQSTFVVLVQA